MNVLTLSPRLESGGLQRYLIAVARGLEERGHRVVVGYGGEPSAQERWLRERQIKVVRLTSHVLDFRTTPQWLTGVRKLVAAHRPDVLHAHSLTAGAVAVLAAPRTPCVVTLHGALAGRERRDARLARVLPVTLTAASNALARQFREYEPSLEIEVVHSGIDMEEFDRLAREPAPVVPDGRPRFVCVARHDPPKGVDVAIRAFAPLVNEFPSATLVLVGEGEATQDYRDLVAALELEERVVFAGDLANPAPAILGADAAVLSSRQEGGVPLAVLEALTLGVPVIASNIGGIPELITARLDGELVDVDDVPGFADAMRRLARDPERAKTMGEAGRRRVQKDFSVLQLVERYESILEDRADLRPDLGLSSRFVDLAGYSHGKARILAHRTRRAPMTWEGVRILGYHRVSPDRDRLAVGPTQFRDQMKLLQETVEIVALENVYDVLASGSCGRFAAVTLDDGYRDNLEYALPVLYGLDIPATIFVPTAIIDGTAPCTWYEQPPAFLDWDDIRSLLAGGLVDVQPHTATHRDLTALSGRDARDEIELSAARMQQITGRVAHTLCYPAGLFGSREQRLVQEAGLRGAVTVRPGVNRPGTPTTALRRTMIADLDTLSDFRAKVEGALDAPSILRRISELSGR